MPFNPFKNKYKTELERSAKMVASGAETREKILGSVMLAAGVTGAVSFAAATAKVAAMGKAATIKTICAVAAAAVGVTVAGAAGMVYLSPPSIKDISVEDSADWAKSSIVVTVESDFTTKSVIVIPESAPPINALPGDAGTYSVPVYANGVYTVEVNGQTGRGDTAQVEVTNIDEQIPSMVNYTVAEDAITIYFTDSQSGVNWRRITAFDAHGNQVSPLRTDPEKGCAVFSMPESNLDVYVEDLVGNKGKSTISVTERT